jgi:hypothetical protein
MSRSWASIISCDGHVIAARPAGWTDRELAERIDQSEDDFKRGQGLLDDVAIAIGVPATPEPRWWERNVGGEGGK